MIYIYGRETGCKFCDIAKDNLIKRWVDFRFIDIDNDDNLKRIFKKAHTTVPQVYEDDMYLGDSSVTETCGTSPVESELYFEGEFGDIDFN